MTRGEAVRLCAALAQCEIALVLRDPAAPALLSQAARHADGLPPDALVSSSQDTLLAAHFGWNGVWAWEGSDVVSYSYGAGRRFRHFYLSSDELARVKSLWRHRDEVQRQFRKLGVTHVVLLPKIGQSASEVLLRSLTADLEKKGRAHHVYGQKQSAVELWRIDP